MARQLDRAGNVITVREDVAFLDKIHHVHMSDVHLDSPACDRALFHRHMKEADALGAIVQINGDLFDAMQGRDDPRRSMSDLKALYKVDNYIDALVKDVADELRPYKQVSYIIGLGNHETSILKHNGTNLCEGVAMLLRMDGIQAVSAGYYSWVRVMAMSGKRRSDSILTYAHHGMGGNSPVTRGVIDTSRQGVYLDGVDVVVNGHNHQNYHVALRSATVNRGGREVYKTMHYLRTPGYKVGGIESGNEHGFDVEKHPEPTPRGCAFLTYGMHEQWVLAVDSVDMKLV